MYSFIFRETRIAKCTSERKQQELLAVFRKAEEIEYVV